MLIWVLARHAIGEEFTVYPTMEKWLGEEGKHLQKKILLSIKLYISFPIPVLLNKLIHCRSRTTFPSCNLSHLPTLNSHLFWSN
jgi:hypothetical protein